jgi:hypothetical protein
MRTSLILKAALPLLVVAGLLGTAGTAQADNGRHRGHRYEHRDRDHYRGHYRGHHRDHGRHDRHYTVYRPRRAPPVIRHQHVYHRPGHVWVSGRYDWRGNDYVWVDGYYQAQQPNRVWVDGSWTLGADGFYVWVDGTWQDSPSYVSVRPAPNPGHVWVEGHWRWRHGHRVWVPGHWQRRW